MSVKVLIPKHLARILNNQTEIDVEASDLKATLDILSRDYRLEDVLLNREGHLQPHIRVAVDEDLVTTRKGADLTQVPVAGKTVEIHCAFAGG